MLKSDRQPPNVPAFDVTTSNADAEQSARIFKQLGYCVRADPAQLIVVQSERSDCGGHGEINLEVRVLCCDELVVEESYQFWYAISFYKVVCEIKTVQAPIVGSLCLVGV